MTTETKPARQRLFHPEKLFGELIAVRVDQMVRHPTRVNEYGLLIDWATADGQCAFGEYVKHGGLVNQMQEWRGEGVVVGLMGQSGAGLQTPWALHPVPESQRDKVLMLLDMDPVAGWFVSSP